MQKTIKEFDNGKKSGETRLFDIVKFLNVFAETEKKAGLTAENTDEGTVY